MARSVAAILPAASCDPTRDLDFRIAQAQALFCSNSCGMRLEIAVLTLARREVSQRNKIDRNFGDQTIHQPCRPETTILLRR